MVYITEYILLNIDYWSTVHMSGIPNIGIIKTV